MAQPRPEPPFSLFRLDVTAEYLAACPAVPDMSALPRGMYEVHVEETPVYRSILIHHASPRVSVAVAMIDAVVSENGVTFGDTTLLALDAGFEFAAFYAALSEYRAAHWPENTGGPPKLIDSLLASQAFAQKIGRGEEAGVDLYGFSPTWMGIPTTLDAGQEIGRLWDEQFRMSRMILQAAPDTLTRRDLYLPVGALAA